MTNTRVHDDRFSFLNMQLNRASTQRKNSDWLQEKYNQDNTQILLMFKGRFLFKSIQILTFNVATLSQSKLNIFTESLNSSNTLFLGIDNETPMFVCDLSFVSEAELTNVLNEEYSLVDLRSALAYVTDNQAAMLGFASSLSYWHRANLFCGFCGNKTQPQHGGHMMSCTNSACNKEVFPRTDPVVIMLVEYKPDVGPAMCLLAEHHRTPEKVVSTLAGFIDPAETLEQAVMREVKEESGVNVTHVDYIASQPWPFPHSLMMGFYATTNDPTIKIDDEEIRDAKWFTADEIREFDNWGDDSDNYKLPRKESISRYLINTWLEQN